MRARNAEESRVLELSKTLPPLDLEDTFHFDLDGKIEEVMDYMSYNSSFYENGHWIRPTWEEVVMMAQLVNVEEYQVIRYYTFDCNQRYVSGYLRFKDGEVAQRWIKDGKQVAFVARKAHNNHLHWCLNTELGIRKDYNFGGLDSMRIESLHDKAFTWDVVKNNVITYCERYGRYGFSDAFVFTPFGEYLYKCERELFRYAEYHGVGELMNIEPSVRIAHRNHYKPSDVGMWIDYINMLAKLGKDVRSPHYVCPLDLKREHDRLNKKIIAMKAKEEMLKKQKENADYISRMEKYFGLHFTDKNISIEPLRSVQEFYEEGEAMHHCVYTCGYYKSEKDCIILSAKDLTTGKRIETIEVSLKNFKIKQSRAFGNGISEYHDEIADIVKRNVYQIKNIARGKGIRAVA